MIRPEVGKRYRTRDGREARVRLCESDGPIRRYYGDVLRGDGHWWPETWTMHAYKTHSITSSVDLIECIGESDGR